MGYTPTPLDGSTPPLPMAAGVPFGTNTTTPTEMGPINANSGNPVSPVSLYVKDGNDLAQGATTDASVVGDTSGSLSAKLRGLSKILNDIWDSVNHRLHVDLNNVTASLAQANQVPVSNAGQQGELTIGGTLTANSDNSITFSGNATVARRIRIQNESGGTIYWNCDATASAGSPSLAAPAANAVMVEWINAQCTTLHIFIPTGGTTTLNGSGGVKVTAWA